REVHERLEGIEPLVPEDRLRERQDGRHEILAWQSEPVAHVVCGPAGDLWLQGLELPAWQAIELPRRWSDPDRRADEHPGRPLGRYHAVTTTPMLSTIVECHRVLSPRASERVPLDAETRIDDRRK